MKRIFSILALGLATFSARASGANIATVAAEAAENTFAGHNYSWHTIVTHSDGTSVDVVGQVDRSTNAVSIQDGTRNFQSITIDYVRFALEADGWKKLSEPAGDEHGLPPPPPPSDDASAPSEPPPHFSRGGHGLGFGGPHLFAPADNISHLIERITDWSSSDGVIVGKLSGPALHRRWLNKSESSTSSSSAGSSSATAGGVTTGGATESSVLSLWIQDGLISKAQLVTTRPAPDASGTSKTETIVTTITAVGSTAITVPAEVQALLTSTS